MKKSKYVWKMNEVDVDDLETIMICAVRYAIGRQTYMPALVVEFIRRNEQFVTMRFVRAALDDIAFNERGHNLGDRCDEIVWLTFKDWLMKKKEKLTEGCAEIY